MSLACFEVGIVSDDRALVDFLSDVFELEAQHRPVRHAGSQAQAGLSPHERLRQSVAAARNLLAQLDDPERGAS